MEINMTLTSTRKMPCALSKEDFDALMDPNTEAKVTLVASPVEIATPIDTEEGGEPVTVKLKVVHVDVVRTTKYD